MNCCVDNEIYFLFLALSAPGLPALLGTVPDDGTVQEFLAYDFQKKVSSHTRLINWRDEEPYSLFTWKINQAERLNNIIQASRGKEQQFLLQTSLSLSKQPSLIVWKVSWLNVNCTTPLYVAWNDDLKIFPVIIYRVVFAPWPSHRSPTRDRDRYRTPHQTAMARCNQHYRHYTLILIENRKSSRRHSHFLLSPISHWLCPRLQHNNLFSLVYFWLLQELKKSSFCSCSGLWPLLGDSQQSHATLRSTSGLSSLTFLVRTDGA